MNRPRISPLLRCNFSGCYVVGWVAGGASFGGCRWRAERMDRSDSGSSEATVRIPRFVVKFATAMDFPGAEPASYEVDFYLPEMVKGYRQRYGQPPLTVYRGM